MLGNEAGVELAAHKPGMRQQRGLERDVAADATNDEAVERLAHLGNRIKAVLAVHDELGDHRVVVHRDLATIDHARVDAHAVQVGGVGLVHGLRRRLEAHQAACAGQEVAERVFGVDAALHRPAIALHLGLRQRQLLAGCDADHQLHQINAGDALGHRVFHLQAGVHLQEVEILVFADHELHRARALVLHRLGEGHGLLAHGLARGVGDEGRRRLFDHLLVAALDRAFALVQVNHVAVRIAQHLDLDVARLQHVFFDEHAVVAEAVAGFVAAAGEALEGFLVVEGHAKALAATAGRGLDHDRVADVPGNLHRALRRFDGVVPARDGVDLGLVGQLLGGDLVAHGRDGEVRGPMKAMPSSSQRLAKASFSLRKP
jgi:hypothetical protein